MADNRIFNVNGSGKEMLQHTLSLAFWQHRSSIENLASTKGWRFDPEVGFILMWSSTSECNKFPVPLSAEDVTPMVWGWLKSEEAMSMEFNGWDSDVDHDGHNTLGWRVYCEDWGNIRGNAYAICAIRPAYQWHGK